MGKKSSSILFTQGRSAREMLFLGLARVLVKRIPALVEESKSEYSRCCFQNQVSGTTSVLWNRQCRQAGMVTTAHL